MAENRGLGARLGATGVGVSGACEITGAAVMAGACGKRSGSGPLSRAVGVLATGGTSICGRLTDGAVATSFCGAMAAGGSTATGAEAATSVAASLSASISGPDCPASDATSAVGASSVGAATASPSAVATGASLAGVAAVSGTVSVATALSPGRCDMGVLSDTAASTTPDTIRPRITPFSIPPPILPSFACAKGRAAIGGHATFAICAAFAALRLTTRRGFETCIARVCAAFTPF